MRAGFAPSDIVFSGVGKSPDEIERAVPLGLKAINAESAGELERIDRAARGAGRARARRGARESRHRRGHPSAHFHGPAHQQVRRARSNRPPRCTAGCRSSPDCSRSAFTCISARRSSAPSRFSAPRCEVVRLARELRDGGIELEHIDVGGGLGISYDGSPCADGGRVRRRRSCHREAIGACRLRWSRARSIVGAAGCAARARGRSEAGCRAAITSRCSTPA